MESQKPPAKVIVCGCGYWGKNLVRVFHELGALVAVVDPDLPVTSELARGAPIYKDLQAALASELRAAVVIATPAETHYQLARLALMDERDVFVEKPITTDWKDAADLVSIAIRHAHVLMVGHLMHYHPAYVRMKDMIARGELGKLQYIYSSRLNLGKFRNEENVLMSFAPHDVSMILGLTAPFNPTFIQAVGSKCLGRKVEDVTVLHLKFPETSDPIVSGLSAHVYVSWLHPYKEHKFVVMGEKGMLVFDDTLPLSGKLMHYHGPVNLVDGVPTPSKVPAVPVALEDYEPLKAECSHFLACVEKKATCRTPGKDGLEVLKVLLAAEETMKPQPLPDDGSDEYDRETVDEPVEIVPYTMHQPTTVDVEAQVGKGTTIWRYCNVMKGSKVGEFCNLGQNVSIHSGAVVGNRVKIQNNVSVYAGVTIEDDVFLGPSMVFTNVKTPRAFINRQHDFTSTLICQGASIGANATIVCGVTIGEYALVGAGAVVTKDVLPYSLVYGNPAEVRGRVCKCGETLKLIGGPSSSAQVMVCPRCSKSKKGI